MTDNKLRTGNLGEDITTPVLFQKGKYAFIDLLTAQQEENSTVPYFSAKAIAITEKEGKFYGDIVLVRLSDLILKNSVYIDEHGQHIEAHKLYTWPRNLGSTEEWTAAKQQFLNDFILFFPIEVLSVQEYGGVTWRFITPENFKNLHEGIAASKSFQEFACNPDDYFFLRRIANEPK